MFALLISIALAHLSFTLFLLKKFGINGDKEYREGHDDFSYQDTAEEPTDSELMLLRVEYSFRCLIHNLDIISDMLYLVFVPALNHTFFKLQVISILSPILIIIFFVCARNAPGAEMLYAYIGIVPLIELNRGYVDRLKLQS